MRIEILDTIPVAMDENEIKRYEIDGGQDMTAIGIPFMRYAGYIRIHVYPIDLKTFTSTQYVFIIRDDGIDPSKSHIGYISNESCTIFLTDSYHGLCSYHFRLVPDTYIYDFERDGIKKTQYGITNIKRIIGIGQYTKTIAQLNTTESTLIKNLYVITDSNVVWGYPIKTEIHDSIQIHTLEIQSAQRYVFLSAENIYEFDTSFLTVFKRIR